MDETHGAAADPQALLMEWLKTANSLFSGPTKKQDVSSTSENTGKKGNERVTTEALSSIIKTWGVISSAMSEPSAMDSLYRSMAILPDAVSHVIQSGLRGYLRIQNQFMEKMTTIGQSTEAYSFDTIDHDSVKIWSDIYQKEVQRYFNVPALGLSRFYQERMNQTLDKFNLFNSSLIDFMQLLSLPFEKSFKVLQDKIEELTSKESLPEDPQELYRLWIKILEGHFMTLFKSPEYTKKLASTLDAMDNFLSARNSIITDALQSLPIPTDKDMDALYEELYHLKKKVKELEKSGKNKG